MAFSHARGIQINGASFIDVGRDMHMHMYGGHMGLNASHHGSTPFNQPVVLKPVLPSRPRLVIGRAGEIETLVDALLTVAAPRLAILGPGGMGKTTLALTVLHDGRLSPRWPRSQRYFIDCEGVSSVELFVKELADVLRIPPNDREFDVFDDVLRTLAHQPAILCLDNFETPWEDLSIRPSIEEALQRLDELHDLALLITMRGIQRPAALSINWLTTLEPLTPLTLEDAKSLFKQISHEMDSWSEELVRAVDGIPLAVKLLAQLILEGTETTKSLWDRWSKEWTTVVENGGNDRLSKLDTSIQLSVSRVDAPAQQLLGILALLPDGLISSQEHINDLQTRIPMEINVKAALTILERKSLVFRSSNRYQMLSPIRHFTLKHSAASIGVQRGLIETYLTILLNHRDYTDATSYSIVHPEISNFRNILSLAFEMRDIPDLSSAAIAYTYTLRYHGLATADIIRRALCTPGLTPRAEADCLHCLGVLHMCRDELDDAEQPLKQALELHEQVQDIHGQANDHLQLGKLHMCRYKLDDAEQSLKRALELHEESLKHALELHEEVQDIHGQAYDHQELGALHRDQDEFDNAMQSLKRALELHEEVQDIHGQASDHQYLGMLHMRRDELDDAEQSLKRALELYEHLESILGQADDHQELGRALELYEQVESILGQANNHQQLGMLHMRRDELDDAEQSLKRALELYEHLGSILGQADDHQELGVLYMKRDELDNAEQSLKRALELHEQLHDIRARYPWDQANDHHELGRLHMRQNEFDDAERSLIRALELHEQAQAILGQAYDQQELGVLHMQRDELDAAEQSLNRALCLYEQIPFASGEASIQSLLITLSARRSQNSESSIN
ncbi:Tetratricopeptide repeat protein 28 [Hypsizygus marmoreus]|uniref:Tetratricopeptide repeat protein 28 n=1 Tax=Hypsizygus marmoreus TaxID=39966 RepID=A0A369JTI3_HYPMA|nr:Tetratricopeptide repeat protein 28 [Hypsizygus marmoreus]